MAKRGKHTPPGQSAKFDVPEEERQRILDEIMSGQPMSGRHSGNGASSAYDYSYGELADDFVPAEGYAPADGYDYAPVEGYGNAPAEGFSPNPVTFNADPRAAKKAAKAQAKEAKRAAKAQAKADKAQAKADRKAAKKAAKRGEVPAVELDAEGQPIELNDGELSQYSSDQYVGRKGKKNKTRRRRWVALRVLLLLIIFVGAITGWCYWSASVVKDDMATISAKADALSGDLKICDYKTAAADAWDIHDAAEEMYAQTTSIPWIVGSYLPEYGEKLRAIATLANALESVSGKALVPVTQALKECNPGEILKDGKVNGEGLQTLLSAISGASDSLQATADLLNAQEDSAFAPVNDMVIATRVHANTMLAACQQYAGIEPVLADVLCSGKEQSYLVVLTSQTQARSSAGEPVAMGMVSMRDGEITVGKFKTIDELFSKKSRSVSTFETISAEELRIFGRGYSDITNVTMNPDFPTVAKYLADGFRKATGEDVDGVICMTPAVLQKVLNVTGYVKLSDGTKLTGDNASEVLQNSLYWSLTHSAKSKKNAKGAKKIAKLSSEAVPATVNKLLSKGLDEHKLPEFVNAVSSCVANRNLLFWMRDDGAEACLTKSGVGAALSFEDKNPELGIYVNVVDNTQMGMYLSTDTVVEGATYKEDGSTVYQMTTTITNTLSSGKVSSKSKYITGKKGILNANVLVFSPYQCTASDFSKISGVKVVTKDFKGLEVHLLDGLKLKPGKSITFKYSVDVPSSMVGQLEIASNPVLGSATK